MDALKSAKAAGMEKIQNVVAKVDFKIEKKKAAVTEKAKKKAASEESGEEEATSNRDAKEAELYSGYEQKLNEHASEKQHKIAPMSQRKSEKQSARESSGVSNDDAPIESIGAPAGEELPADFEQELPEAPIPMHGSGVPTHSELHHDPHDVDTMNTMNGAPHTGSYMI